jgi:predicted nuclease of restriction endonuclease-like (RecB) superfamily
MEEVIHTKMSVIAKKICQVIGLKEKYLIFFENGWSRNTLETWIESDLYKRQGKAITNFKETLPELQSDLAEQTIKDPYNFSFLALDKKHREAELEQGLMDHIQKFLLELGDGFAFVGRQYEIEVAGKEYIIDLLFYHLKLRCYFVIELLCCAQHNLSYVA